MYKEYKAALISKLDSLEQMYNNAVKQGEVIKKRNEKLLLTLMNKMQKHIDKLNKINNKLEQFDKQIYVEDEIKEIKEKIQLKTKEIIKVNQENYMNVQMYMKELEESIRKINMGKKVILNGYFKRSNQTYGYFIDAKK